MKVVLVIAVLVLSVTTVQAEICSYTDSDGVKHYTDRKTENDMAFKEFMKNLKKDRPSQQQTNKASQRRSNYCEEHCLLIKKTGVTVDMIKCYDNCMTSD